LKAEHKEGTNSIGKGSEKQQQLVHTANDINSIQGESNPVEKYKNIGIKFIRNKTSIDF